MKVLFFDGYCSLCNSFVDALIRRDKRDVLQFASLQGETARSHLPSFVRTTGDVDTVIYLRDGKIYDRSSAILWVLQDLGGLWMMTGVFFVIPQFLRDIVYRWVARHRYRWFPKRETCRVPSPLEKKKLLP